MIGALAAAFAWAYAAEGIRSAVEIFGLGAVLRLTVLVIAVGAFAWLVARRVHDGRDA